METVDCTEACKDLFVETNLAKDNVYLVPRTGPV